MTHRAKSLARLLAVMEAKASADRARASKARQEEQQFRDQLAALEGALSERRDSIADGTAEMQPSVDPKWQDWMMARRGQLNIGLAGARARTLAETEKLAQSTGRQKVMETLVDRARSDDRRTRTRRSDYTS